ncbi:hypothetical protein GCM10009528_07000 [Kineococcus aurantiacus]
MIGGATQSGAPVDHLSGSRFRLAGGLATSLRPEPEDAVDQTAARPRDDGHRDHRRRRGSPAHPGDLIDVREEPPAERCTDRTSPATLMNENTIAPLNADEAVALAQELLEPYLMLLEAQKWFRCAKAA